MAKLNSFAKINLGLEVVGKRPDGYHLLKTIFQTVDLYDTIEIHENHSGQINLSGNIPSIEWNQHNTICKAIDKFYKKFDVSQGFDIYVEKRIPPGSGLGGGSSNAAVILMYLIDYFNINTSLDEMIPLATEIGADVPFFFLGGTAVAEGIGEKLFPLENIDDKRIDIVIPNILVPTRQIFSHFILTSCSKTSKITNFTGSKKYEILENDLETITFELFPTVGLIKNMMKNVGYEMVLMSGSGSSIYGIYNSEHKNPENETRSSGPNIEHVNHQLTQRLTEMLTEKIPGSQVVATHTITSKNYFNRIGAWPSGKASVFGADIRRFESSRPSFFQ